MKRFTQQELQKYIQHEVEKICIAEGLVKKPWEPTPIEFESSKKDIVAESENVQIEEVKLLAEELTRMKNLVDFRSPLLKRD
jgi:hypothetical protein